ncbi:hypothetical protein CASFOL_022123 [Castilleja foliolosa]|uniref:Disease resistance protein RGA3 n=1 Tax=Castilleja foliolosa TaxID=1961234 RepID=A0ABD3CZV0_9LAMI
MAEAAVGATIEILLENLFTVLKDQIGLFRSFKKDSKKLQETISMVKAFLDDAEEKQVTDRDVKDWLRRLEALAFEADNVSDDISYQLLSKQVGPTENKTVMKKVQSFVSCSSNDPTENKTVMKKVQSFFSCSFAHRLKLGHRIRDINEELKSINQEATGLGLQIRIANARNPVFESPETDSFSSDPVYGRENDVSRIVEKLITTTPSSAAQVLSVLPIVGMGGLGKTTLARKVFGDEKIISRFGGDRVWVHVPRIFDVINILKNILTSLTNEKVEIETRQALLQKLQEHLRTKTYLLVLDDVWNEERDKWDSFVKSLSGISSANGNCMIVTTRSRKVASIVRTLSIHELGSLSGDDCWSIIKAKAFINSGDIPMEFEIVGRNIAKKCRGLPLAAEVVGGLLRDKSRDKWQAIENNWLSEFGDDENTINKILKQSFDHLSPPSLKKCFAYCSILPKGYRIEKEQLIELWMAEGFFQNETTGSKFANLLLQNSLLQVAERDDYGNITHCNMHDLVHDLAWSVLYENDNVTDGVCQNRYIGYKSSGDGLLPIPEGQERYVRTLFFSGNVSNIRFSDFESLHSLTLVGRDINELPTSIRELKHLRYLDISMTSIKYLPDSIGELYHLQTLREKKQVLVTSYLERLPDALSCLTSLRHLHFRGESLHSKIGKLTSLQTLLHFHVGSEKGYEVSELGSLKDLKGTLTIHNLENVRDKNEAMGADLRTKSGIYELGLGWDNKPRESDEANDESVLEGLKPHPNLKGLVIWGFKGKSLPLLEELNNLMKIILSDCTECEELPMLGHLPHLKYLSLLGLTNVKSIRSSFYGNINKNDTIVAFFPALERLRLLDMSNLKEWDEVDLPLPSQVFPRLEHLEIQGCNQLTRAPSHFPCLKVLNMINMESGLPLENICGNKTTSLTILNFTSIVGLKCFPNRLLSNNHNLRRLKIFVCPNMTHLVHCLGGGGGPSLLRELTIYNCRSLRELPDDLHSLDSLETLSIDWCPNLKSIPNPNSGTGKQQQGFTSLRELHIEKCQGLTNMDTLIGCLHKMTRLTHLTFFHVPEFSTIGNNNSLQAFKMGPFSSNNNNITFNETVGATLRQFISLRRLELWGMNHWDVLPDQLQHLYSLEELSLEGFGIEALPEWFGNLSSLNELQLRNCKKLRHLASKQAMQRLSKSILLVILGCPLILKRNGEFIQIVDSERHKISHIIPDPALSLYCFLRC